MECMVQLKMVDVNVDEWVVGHLEKRQIRRDTDIEA